MSTGNITQKPIYNNTPSTERNQALYKDYKSGMAILDIQIKYKLSGPRVYQIVKAVEAKKHE